MKESIEYIKSSSENFAIIIRSSFQEPGLSFVTHDENILQVGYMEYPSEKKISPHRHKPYKRETFGTQEFITISEFFFSGTHSLAISTS